MNLNKLIFKHQYKLYLISFIIALLISIFNLAEKIIISIFFGTFFMFVFFIAYEEDIKLNGLFNRKVSNFREIYGRGPNDEEEDKLFEEAKQEYWLE